MYKLQFWDTVVKRWGTVNVRETPEGELIFFKTEEDANKHVEKMQKQLPGTKYRVVEKIDES